MPGEISVAVTLTQDWHRVPGGTAVAANALAAALAARSDVHVVGAVPPRGAPTPGFEPPVGTAALRLGPPWLYDSWSILGRPRISSAAPGVDLVHFTLPVPPPHERVPLVATVHDVLPITMPQLFTSRGAKLMRRGLRRLAGSASRVMVPSLSGREEFVRVGFDPGRLVVVPLGVDPPEPTTPEALAGILDRLGVEPPYVLFVGTAEPRKGLDVLAAAMAELDRPEVTLVLVGPEVGWWLGAGHRARCEPDSCRRRTWWLRFLGRSASRPALAAEGFGLPVLEAMKVRAPVVSPPRDADGGARQLTWWTSPSRRRPGAAGGRDRGRASTTPGSPGACPRPASGAWTTPGERTAERVVEVYREALG
ncbi:MAG: glycosyltransferase [Microthrixaceae bacterium]